MRASRRSAPQEDAPLLALIERLRQMADASDIIERRDTLRKAAAALAEKEAARVAERNRGDRLWQECENLRLQAAEKDAALRERDAEMRRRDEQWLEMITLCDEHMAKIRTESMDSSDTDAWITVSKNLGVARVVIESRLAALGSKGATNAD